jgi:NAD(P)-dependent dehydrogenase (short-subunit alcohol dehydrogenase family)
MNNTPQSTPPILAHLFGLEGQVAVVVGGAGRIGRALCRALAEAGAAVCVFDRDGHAAESLAAQLARETARPVLAHGADATQPEELKQAVEHITRRLGPPRILVNSAQFRGQGFYSSSVDDYPLEAWDQVLSVNLTGVHLACQAFGRSMARHGGGAIVNLASTYGVVSPDPRIYGQSGVNSPVSYAASKAGVIQLTRYLAVHWRDRQIRVNCLVPGGVYDHQDDEFVQHYCQRTPLGRMARAEDYQGAVLFMVSPASQYMTGSVVTVDGGWTAW